jgi:hypothetical protein
MNLGHKMPDFYKTESIRSITYSNDVPSHIHETKKLHCRYYGGRYGKPRRKRMKRENWTYVHEDEWFPLTSMSRTDQIRFFFHQSKLPEIESIDRSFEEDSAVRSHTTCLTKFSRSTPARIPLAPVTKCSTQFQTCTVGTLSACVKEGITRINFLTPQPTSRAERCFLQWYKRVFTCVSKRSSANRKRGIVQRHRAQQLSSSNSTGNTAVQRNVPPRERDNAQPDSWRKLIRVKDDGDIIWVLLRGSVPPHHSALDLQELAQDQLYTCGLYSESAPCLSIPSDIRERQNWRCVPIMKCNLFALPVSFPSSKPFTLPPHIMRASLFSNKEDQWSLITKSMFLAFCHQYVNRMTLN